MVMTAAASKPASKAKASTRKKKGIARTIRFPEALRERLGADAERCGRSFEAHVIAILRRHYGEDVDIAPAPDALLTLARSSLQGVKSEDTALLTQRLIVPE